MIIGMSLDLNVVDFENDENTEIENILYWWIRINVTFLTVSFMRNLCDYLENWSLDLSKNNDHCFFETDKSHSILKNFCLNFTLSFLRFIHSSSTVIMISFWKWDNNTELWGSAIWFRVAINWSVTRNYEKWRSGEIYRFWREGTENCIQ